MNALLRRPFAGMFLAGIVTLVCLAATHIADAAALTTILSNYNSLSDNNGTSNRWRPGHRYKLYTFEAHSDRTYVIDVRSGNGRNDGTRGFFDTYIYLIDPTGRIVASNDDYGGTLNSHIRYGTLRTGGAGTYTVVVTSVVRDD
jgi:hypothetical protein